MEAKTKHEKKRFSKRVSFNMEKEKALKEFADSINFSVTVKKLLEIEMKKRGKS